ncbi:MAG: hypothetical protein QXW67_02080 [Candidatus Micrarchaeia archaeon]
MTKVVFIVLDGIGDRPIKEKNGKTPLEIANKPNIDRMAKEGITGISYPVGPGWVPGSDTGHLALFGYDPFRFYVGRGILEALGAGIDIKPGEIAFRSNFCTVEKKGDEWYIIDRRAGRISNSEAKEISKSISSIKVKIKDKNGKTREFESRFYHTKSHRGVLVIRSLDPDFKLNPLISDTDSHHEGRMQWAKPLDENENAEITSEVLNETIREINRILEKHKLNEERKKKNLKVANSIMTRGASMIEKMQRRIEEGAEYSGLYGWAVRVIPFSERYEMKAACVAGGALYKGVAKYIGMDIINVPTATADYNTDLEGKINTVINELEKYDFVFLHIKATDIAGHDGDWKMKVKMIEKIDKALKPITKLNDTVVVLTGDHSTPCNMKSHSADPVPILIWGPKEMIRSDDVKRFDEKSTAKGGLGNTTHLNVMPIVMGIIKKAKMYGT